MLYCLVQNFMFVMALVFVNIKSKTHKNYCISKLEFRPPKKQKKLRMAQPKNFSSAQGEINKLTKLRNRILSNNQKLQDQISKLSADTAQFENRNLIISEQLDKSLEEITNLQCIKDKLEERNVQLETEVKQLQEAFNELNHEILYKVKSFMNIEHELSETKCSKEEVCTDCKMVLSSVRNWLENQRSINIVLTATIKEKNTVIDELTREKTMLLKNIKEVCERYESLAEELQTCRQYFTEMNFDRKMIKSSTPKQRLIYTLGFQGSEGDSPSTSPIFIDEQNSDYMNDDNDGEPNPARWMRNVRNMSEDLLKSKKYWQTKMVKPKKIKPVKESKTT